MISLIIPCYNEEENLDKLLNKLDFLLKEFDDEKIEIIIVNNGSNDNSHEILKKNELYLKNKISILNIQKNKGYGDGIHQGINSSKGDVLCWFHADLQFDPIDAIRIFKKNKEILSNGNVIIKGKRINRSLLDSFFTTGMSFFTYLLFRKNINDINAQPKIFSKSYLKF